MKRCPFIFSLFGALRVPVNTHGPGVHGVHEQVQVFLDLWSNTGVIADAARDKCHHIVSVRVRGNHDGTVLAQLYGFTNTPIRAGLDLGKVARSFVEECPGSREAVAEFTRCSHGGRSVRIRVCGGRCVFCRVV